MHFSTRLLLISCSLTAGVFARSQSVPARVRLQPSQELSVQVELKNSIVQQAMGQAIDFRVDGQAVHTYRVAAGSADSQVLKHEVNQLAFRFDGMGTKKTFDSRNPDDLNGQFGEPVRRLLNKRYDLLIDSLGTVIRADPPAFTDTSADERVMLVFNMLRDLTGIAEPPAAGSAGFFRILPSKGAAVGDSWSDTIRTSTEEGNTVYTLKRISDSTIEIGYEEKLTRRINATVMGMDSKTSLTSTGSGTIIVDRGSGVMRSKTGETQSTGTAEVMGNSTPVTARTTLNIRVIGY